MSRLIDADALRKEIHCAYSDDLEILDHIDAQPTITPEPHWIPWTGECDLMDNEEVLVCQKDGQIRHAMFYDYGDKKTFVTWEEGITIYGVVAYMPLPEPYKGVNT